METTTWIEDELLKIDKLYDEGEYTECKRLLNYMLDEEPGCGKAHNLLGVLYVSQLGDYEKAAKHFRLATKFSPNWPNGVMNYAYILNDLNRHEELLAHAQEALKVPGIYRYGLQVQVARSYEMNGHYKKSIKAYKEAGRMAMNKFEVTNVEEAIQRVKNKVGALEK